MTAYRDLDEDEDWGQDDDTDVGDDSDDEPVVPCPSCGRDILEDTPRCPYCEQYISAEEHAVPGKPTWVIVTAVVCLAVALWWVVAAF